MKGVYFDNKHSYDDFGLILAERPEISPPQVKKKIVEIHGADNTIDLSDVLTGDVFFENRRISCKFTVIGGRDKWSSIYSEILNYLHGKKMKITFDDDPNFYYYGRVAVNSWKSSKITATIVIEAEVDAYKLDALSSVDGWLWDLFDFETGIINELNGIEVNGTNDVIIYGRKKKVVPEFYCSQEMTVTFKGTTYNLKSGKNRILGIQICEGDNILTFKGTGTVNIDYVGGEL